MPQPQKFQRVADVMEQRIRQGDYLLRPLPSERKIAEENDVSHMTARKAIRILLERHVLTRQANGGLDISPAFQAKTGPTPVVMLYPAFASTYLTLLWQTVSDSAASYGLSVRPVQYVHWDDPVVLAAVANPAGAIVVPASHDVPPHLVPTLRSNRAVLLDFDLSKQQIPSIQLYADDHFTLVFDHLRSLGHQHIDCLSTHVHNPVIENRLRLWRNWKEQNKIQGDIHENPAPSFSDPTPFAHQAITQRLKQGSWSATALVCTTFPAAIGAIRACWEHGLNIGRDISICSMNIEPPAKFLTPSVTGIDMPDLSAVLGQCFNWFSSNVPWEGPMRLEPARAEFFIGESTVQTP